MKADLALQFAGEDPDKASTQATDRTLFQRFFAYVWQHYLLLLIAFFVIACLAIAQVILPQIVRYAIDVVIPEKNTSLLPWVAGTIVGISVLTGGLNFCRIYLMSLLGEKIVTNLRDDLYQHIQTLSISFFAQRRTGDLMSRLTQDINAIGNLISADLSEILVDSFTVVAIAIYLFRTDWQLALLLMLTWPLTIYITQAFGKFMRSAYRDAEYQAVEVNNHLQDTLSNIAAIKSFGNEQYEVGRFTERSQSYMKANIRATFLWSLFVPTVDLLHGLSNPIVLVFGSWEAIAGRLSVGELAAFLAYMNQVNRPILRFSKITNILQKALIGAERVFEILATEPEVKEKENATHLTTVKGSIIFEGVGFSYADSEPILHDFSLKIAPGTMVALVGSSGAGKSTVAKLAARFYDPQMGRILMDEYDLRDLSLVSLRSHVGIVSQETLLLYGTIRDNIAYGKLDATDAEIEAVAKAANAHEFITGFPDGYNAIVGERGVTLSGGQRQRLAIARVLLKNPPFVILDEATSALDTESEKLIQASLQQLLQGRTSLVIAHRLSTIQHADCIVVLERGRIIETGTHTELLVRGGRYATLHALQFPQTNKPIEISSKKLLEISLSEPESIS